jgi:uncharacterized SAM-binding protein YcdF (DUF218 family)
MKFYLTGIILIITLIFIIACRRAGSFLVKEDEPLHADATVILMGSISDRVIQAADLYQCDITKTILIVEGSNRASSILKARGVEIISSTEQIRNALIVLGISSDNIKTLPWDAQSTQQETEIIKEYLANFPKIDTLMVVTSSPHIRRAFVIFKNTFRKSKKHTCILCSPNSYTDFNAIKWWQTKDGIETVLLEYLKLMNFSLFERWRVCG